MTTELHNYGKFPDGYNYAYGDITALDEYDTEELQKAGIDEAWYWYAVGSYDVSGQILMRKGDQYDIHDMGHCSCHEPFRHMEFRGAYATLDDIEPGCSAEAYKEIAP